MADGMVYVGGSSMSALDAATGGLRWRYRGGPGYAPPPLLAEGAAYAGYYQIGADTGQPGPGTYGVYAMDPVNGHVRWTHRMQVPSAPVAAADTGYVGESSGRLLALDAGSGRERWGYATAGINLTDPVVAAGTVYVGSGDHKLYALDAATGEARWACTTQASVTSPPVVTDGTVYAGSQDQILRALDAATGHLRWSFPTGAVIQAPRWPWAAPCTSAAWVARCTR